MDTTFWQQRRTVFFPWGVAMVAAELYDQGYLPNIVGASILGALPVAGRVLRNGGYCPATRKNLDRCLSMPYPRNVTIILPGGIAEMFRIRSDIEISSTSIRKGFVEVAMEKGATLVPAYMLGNSKLYEVAQGPLSDFFEWLSRRLKASLTAFHGRWGTLLPYPHRLACALGEPIDTRQFSSVDEVHALWLAHLRDAYNNNKAHVGWEDRQLFFEGEEMPPPPSDPLGEYTLMPTLSKL